MSHARMFGVVALALAMNSGANHHAQAYFESVGKEAVTAGMDRLDKMADRLVRDLFDEARRLIEDLTHKMSDERKAAVVQVGSELEYAIDSLTARFGTETDRAISAASDELKSNLACIEAWMGSMEQIAGKVSALEDDMAIDIESLPFAKRYFSVRRVSGINIVQGVRASYPIRVTGERFGSPNSDEEVVVKAHLGERELSKGATRGPHEVEFLIPANLLARDFKSDEVRHLDLRVTATRTRRGFLCWAFSFASSCEEQARGTFKLLLTPENIGRLEVQIWRPKYDWVATEPLTREVAVRSPETVTLEPLPDRPNGRPRRYAGKPTWTCNNIKRHAWRLPNGTIVLPDDPLLINGWNSSSWVGDPRGPDLERFDREAVERLGFTTGFWANNSCPAHGHCQIAPDVIRSHATELDEVGYCDRMTVAAVDIFDKVRGSVRIVGTAPHDSRFVITTPVETWSYVGMEADPGRQSIEISAQGLADVQVPAGAYATVVFHSFDGLRHDGRLPEAVPAGLKVVQKKRSKDGEPEIYTLAYAEAR